MRRKISWLARKFTAIIFGPGPVDDHLKEIPNLTENRFIKWRCDFMKSRE